MKKYFALLLVVFTLALVGTAMAADSDGGHVVPDTPTPTTDGGQSGSGSSQTTTQTETTTVQNVVVITVEAIKTVNAADVTKGISESIMDSLQTAAADSGMTQEDIDYWSGQAATIQATIEETVANLVNTVAAFDGAEVVTDANAMTATEPAESLVKLIEEASARLKVLADKMGIPEQTAVSILPTIEVNKDGVFKISVPTFKSEMYGLPIVFHANGDGGSGSSGGTSVRAAAVEGEAVFLNSKGEQVSVVPDGSNGEMPGFVTAAVYMKAGAKYAPVIATTVAAAQAKTDLATETKASVQVTEEVLVASTSTFSTYVASSLLEGTTYETIPAGAVATTGWEDSDAEAAYKTADASFDVFTLVAMPSIAAPNAATWYIAAVSFDRGSKTVADLFTGAELEFFPNNVLSEPDTDAVFLQESDGVLVPLDVEDVFGASSRYTRGYVAFQLSAAASKPAIATFLTKAGGGDTPSGPDTPTPVTPVNPGSSGGGCDAGFGALALAVLGAFMVTRRK